MMWKELGIIALIFSILDGLYISIIGDWFNKMIQSIQNNENVVLNIGAAFITYISMMVLLWYFIISEKKTPWEAFLLGVCVYSVYNFTNKATIHNWQWSFSILDTIWGGTLFGLTTLAVQNII